MKTLADLFQFIEVADEMALSMICWCCPISSENEIIYKISKPFTWEASMLLDSEDYKKYDICQFRSNNSMWQNLIDSTMVVLDQEHRVCLISKLLERMNSIIKGGEAYDFVESSLSNRSLLIDGHGITESDCDYIDTAQQFIHAELALLNIVIKIGRAYNIDVKAMINKMGTFYSILYFGVKDKKSSQTRTKKKKDIFKNSTKKKLYSTSKLESIFSYDVDKARLIYQFALLVKAFEISEDKYLAAITNADFTEIIESAIDKKWRVFVIITLTNKIVKGKSWYRKAAESVGITTDKITSNNPFRKSCDDYNKEYEALIKQIAT